MDDFMDDSDLHSIMLEADTMIKSLKESDKQDPLEVLEKAKKLESATDAYVNKRQSSGHFLNDQVNKVRSRIQVNKELLKTTVSNVSQLRSKISSESPFKNKPMNMDFLTDVTKDNIDEKLNEVNIKIQRALRELSSKTKGDSRLEKMLRKYQEIMKETTCLFKKVPDIVKAGAAPRQKVHRRQTDDTDQRAEELLRKMSRMNVDMEVPLQTSKVEEPNHGVGAWIHYEGFDTQDELDRFKILYKKMTGKDPDEAITGEMNTLEVVDEDAKDNSEEGDLEYVEKVFKELVNAREIYGSKSFNINNYENDHTDKNLKYHSLIKDF